MAAKVKEEEKKVAPITIQEVVREVAATKMGKLLLKHLHRDCGFTDTDSRWDPQAQEINPMAIVHNAAQRNVYVRLRKYIPKEFILEIEY